MLARLVITLAERDGRLKPGLVLPGPLGVEALVRGQTPEAAVTTLGRLFSLCRHAQEAAARLAFGLPAPEDNGIARAILRDMLFRLFIALPRAMGRASLPLPTGWQQDPLVAARALFGPTAAFPDNLPDFWQWLKSGEGLAPLLSVLDSQFAPGEAASRRLSFTIGRDEPCENSPARRHARHPVMAGIEGERGRGPLWRIVARMLDAAACLGGWQPAARLVGPGVGEAPSARGLYRIAVGIADGRVTTLCRRTPTDDICHPDGALLSALATLPAAKLHLAPLVVECFDPCLPWTVQETADA